MSLILRFGIRITFFLCVCTDALAVTMTPEKDAIIVSSELECTQVESPANVDPSIDSFMNFSQYLVQSSHWQAVNSDEIAIGFLKSILWCRMAVLNKTHQPSWYLVLNNTRLDHVRFYWLPEGHQKPVQTLYEGDLKSFRPTEHTPRYSLSTSYPVFNIQIPEHQEGMVYFAVKSSSSLNMRPKLHSPESFKHLLEIRKTIQIGFALFIFGIILGNLTLMRFQILLYEVYFFAAIICAALYLWCFHGDASVWLRKITLPFTSILLNQTIIFSGIFSLKFAQTYFNLIQWCPRLNIIYTTLISLLILQISTAPFTIYMNALMTLINSLSMLACFTLILVTVIFFMKRNDRSAVSSAILLGISSIGVILTSLVYLNIIPYNRITDYMLVWIYPIPVLILVPITLGRYRKRRYQRGHAKSA